MAEKQTKKRASGSKLTGKSSGSRKSTSKGSKSKAKTQTPIRREVGAGVCLVLALCTVLGCLGIKGALLSLLIGLFKGAHRLGTLHTAVFVRDGFSDFAAA